MYVNRSAKLKKKVNSEWEETTEGEMEIKKTFSGYNRQLRCLRHGMNIIELTVTLWETLNHWRNGVNTGTEGEESGSS